MAWFRVVGVDSVEYHRKTVLGREDDHPGSALAYYGSRGETPLVWGGKVAERLGLSGAVTDDTYDAIFGRGGPTDPVLGLRLAKTKRPGVELVIAAHKSVAVLGVIGRADDMHAILDAESDATLRYLEAWCERQGNRRGRSQARTPTTGLLWARTRHATSRAGDPAPHDHVLIANLTEMLDAAGGWKALDTAAVRDVNHAATIAGRLAGAAVAVRLGYAIEPDDGPTGKLGHWRLAGIPREVCDELSKRSDEIELHMESSGFVSYRARNVGARTTRAAKTDESPEELLPRWRRELADMGWEPDRLLEHLEEVNRRTGEPDLPTDRVLRDRAGQLLSADGELGNRKCFTRQDVVRVIGPSLYGADPDHLDRAVDAVLQHRDAVPLVGQPAARGRAWAAASVLAAEQAVAEVSRRLAAREGPVVSDRVITSAIALKGREVGGLTPGQSEAVRAICGGGLGLDLIVGTAGAGKTTALDAVRLAYEMEGYRVLGAATSGQAARALGSEAAVEARTVASLLWRLRTGSLRLDGSTVLLLDEAGMTDDRAMLAVLEAAEHAGSKVVVIGDHRQLSAVGLGGGLEALVGRHQAAVHVLDENVRQRDAGERGALAHLRSGDVGAAIEWYVANDRVALAPTRDRAVDAVIGRWAEDERAGKETLLLAWRRVDVAALNARARLAWADAGHLVGPEIVAPGGRRYAVGDRVVALAPLANGAMVTSERAVVRSIADGGITVSTAAGRVAHLHGDEIDAKHLDHAYAVTVHRAQGATVDRAHLLADGGGRELAYVAMSRARESTTVHVVADDMDVAIDDLRREWSAERRDRWVIDVDAPAADGDRRRPDLARRVQAGLRSARLRAEREAVLATIPPDRSHEIFGLHQRIAAVEAAMADVRRGRSVFADEPVGAAAREVACHESGIRTAKEVLRDANIGWRMRRVWKKNLVDHERALGPARVELDRLAEPIEAELNEQLGDLQDELRTLNLAQSDRTMHGRLLEATTRVRSIDRELGVDHRMEQDHGIEL